MSGMRANLQVGEMLQGSAGNLSVRGCLLFKEWDTQDRCFYYWEEWQLIGASSADTWVELDHDPGEVLFYEPVHLQETIEPWALAVGQQLQLTVNGAPHRALVEEVTTGTLEEVVGTPVCPLNIGETMTYVELRLTDPAGVTSRLTIDSHRFRDLLAYRKTTLSSAQQRQFFGRVIYDRRPVGGGPAGGGAGRNIGCALIGAIVSVVLVVGLFSSCSSSTRSSGSADSTSTSDTGSSRTYRHRPVYGGGGGGVGK
ncbi:hypothetical protein [Actinomyces viscosus]|uniref:hypothetical protein n=1 Tax=Actinomyces viscosus TaxID=1656 RepID=UPI0028E725C5|nr:hypothetical protein [Actinomyces viscosus]